MNRKTIIIIICAGIALFLATAALAGWGVYVYTKNSLLTVSSNEIGPTVDTNEVVEVGEYPEPEEIVKDEPSPVVQTVTEGVNWLSAPEKIEQPDIYANPNFNEYKIFYKVANLDSGDMIVAESVQDMGTYINYFQVDKDSNYTLLAEHADEYTVQSAKDLYQAKVQVNRELKYPEISEPATLKVGKLNLIKTYKFGDNEFLADQENRASYVEVGKTDNGTVYELSEDLDTGSNNGVLKSKVYMLVSADSTISTYVNEKSFIADDGSLELTFTDSDQAYTDQNFMAGVSLDGCGSGGVDQVLPSDIPSANLKEIGKAANGDVIYRLQSQQTNVFDVAYNSYTVGRSAEYGNAPMSREDYNKNAIILVWQDPAGDYISFISADYAPMVECGKPVVYLYPETTTNVTVQVDAHVSVSEPAYYNSDFNNMLGGWRTVAQPNGQLTMPSGDVLGSLYWEGKGFGTYPAITRGRVIETKNFEAEVRADMTKLGLNAQEQQDFIDFWQDYVPTQPYTRLSWLDTRAMDALAPLHVSPEPDTTIRVFLDFAGQDVADTDLEPQRLTSVARNGFTVVEWGGLLVGGKK